ncbi:MAG: SH3 domain-containing protein, partial [Anaerolineae bacterium]|nr:SH3 domain-containing protein [Anaerolineae bacterium]
MNLPPLPTDQGCAIATRNAVSVNVRSGPSTDYPAVGALNPEVVYTAIGVNSSRSWYQVQLSSGPGWVAARVTRTAGTCANLPIATRT